MTPAARLASAIEILELIESEGRPADLIAGTYLQARRYIGSGDRRAISERVWGVLRRRARLDWWLGQRRVTPTGRLRMLVDLALVDALTLPELHLLFQGGGYAPAPLSPDERRLIDSLKGRTLVHPAMSESTQLEYPDWIAPRLVRAFERSLAREMSALLDPAPVDLRVNALKSDRAAALAALEAAGLAAKPTALSPLGLRLPARTPLAAQDLFKNGMIEVQDEGSQLVALLLGAKPGMIVADYCSGAGGKALAIAGEMANKGRILALDTDKARSERAAQRLRRAGVDNVERRVIAGEGDKWLKRQAGRCDRVLVDAPCSGTGTWRRNPDQRWRLTEEGLAELVALQDRILASASRLVKPGGRMVYATCSFLIEENEDRIARFLAANPDFRTVPVSEAWKQRFGDEAPCDDPYLKLTPASHKTDGFFAAVMARKG
jgi:16S rRNA (cytosine967-C5)-methyltransferase